IFSIADDPKLVFAGADGLGLFRRSATCCAPWTPFNTGLTSLKITALTTNGDQVFAGTPGSGIFVSTDNGGSWVARNQGVPAKARGAALAFGDNAGFIGFN